MPSLRQFACLTLVAIVSLVCSPANAQKVLYPLGIAVSGNKIFISDKDSPAVWQVVDGKASLFFKGSRKFRTPLNAVRYLGIDKKGDLVAGDSATRDIYRFVGAKPTALTKGAIGNPMGFAVNKAGDLIVANIELHEIVKVPSGGGKPTRIGRVVAPRGVFVDSKDNVWVVSGGNQPLQRFTPAGNKEVIIDKRVFGFPHDIVMDKEEKNIYISDGYGKAIWRIAGKGKPQKFASGKPFSNPTCLAWHGKNLLVVDSRAKAVFSIDPKGKVTTLFQQK